MRPAVLLGLVLALAGPAMPAAAEDEQPKATRALPLPTVDLLLSLARRGFVVRPNGSLSEPYRFPHRTAFVTADSALGAYGLLLRALLVLEAERIDGRVASALPAWRTRLDGADKSGAPAVGAVLASRFLGVLEALHREQPEGAPPGSTEPPAQPSEVPALAPEVKEDLERLHGRGAVGTLVCLGTPFDHGATAAEWDGDAMPEGPRGRVALWWLTRARFRSDDPVHRSALDRLRASMPAALRDTIVEHWRWVGASTLEVPGQGGLFDVEPLEGARFPPGTLPNDGEIVGLDLAARLGSQFAAEALAGRRGPAVALRSRPPRPVDASDASLHGRLTHVLTLLLAGPLVTAPSVARSRAYQALLAQAALGADALERRANGPATAVGKVFGGSDPGLLVHPDPTFWRAFSVLCAEAAKVGADRGLRTAEVPRWRYGRLLAILRAHQASREPFSDLELRTLVQLGGDAWDSLLLEGFGRPRRDGTPRNEKFLEEVLDFEIRAMEKRLAAPPDPARALATPWTLRQLGSLAEIALRFAEAAEAQLLGGEPANALELRRTYGSLLEDILGITSPDPLLVGVPTLREGAHLWTAGITGVDRLLLAYPLGGRLVLCEGAVFAYGEALAADTPSDTRWRERVRRGEILRPTWTGAFLDR